MFKTNCIKVKKSTILSVVLILLLFAFFVFLKQRKENYANRIESQNESHNVDLPINTRFSCANMCAPPARCSITGEQCTSDVDCSGCLKKEGFVSSSSSSSPSSPNNESYFQGINTWRTAFDLGNANYQQKYNASLNHEPFLLHYQKRPTLSGEFEEEEAMAYNTMNTMYTF